MEHEPISLPALLVGKPDVTRLRRELESLEDYLHQAALRKAAPGEVKLPKTSRMLDEFARLNGIDLLHRVDHDRATRILDELLTAAPVLHFSFSAEPSSAFLGKLVTWIRQNIDPTVLVAVGLRPDIAAGCVLRTPNRQFDLSLRQSFADKRDLLAQQLKAEAPSS